MKRLAPAAVALVGCLLAACSGDPEPKVADPTPTPTASATASPSLSPPVTEAVDPQAPYREFIDAYVGAISKSLSTGDPEPWLAMSDPACENCQRLAVGLRGAYEAGGRIKGGSWTVEKVEFRNVGDLGQIWYVDIAQTMERWVDSDGQPVKTVAAGTNLLGFAISGDADGLLMRELRPRQS